jgi:hypothetical protein
MQQQHWVLKNLCSGLGIISGSEGSVSSTTQEARAPSEQEVRKMVDSDITQEVGRAPPTEVEAGAPPGRVEEKIAALWLP